MGNQLKHLSFKIFPEYLENRSDIVSYMEAEYRFEQGKNIFVEDDIIYVYTDEIEKLHQVVNAMRKHFRIVEIGIKVY